MSRSSNNSLSDPSTSQSSGSLLLSNPVHVGAVNNTSNSHNLAHLGTRDLYSPAPSPPRSFDNAMVIGPGFNPVPHRLVTAIISGHYVDLAALIASPSEKSSVPTLTLDGRLVITPPPRKSGPISDIVHWAQAFSIYIITCLYLCHFFPIVPPTYCSKIC